MLVGALVMCVSFFLTLQWLLTESCVAAWGCVDVSQLSIVASEILVNLKNNFFNGG